MGVVSDWFRQRSRAWYLPVAKALASLGLTPNAVSIAGAAAFAGAGLLAALGHYAAAGWVMAVLGPLDRVDGLMARECGMDSRFGAFLDSTLDRFAEFFLFLGVLVGQFRFHGAGTEEAAVIMSALTGSLLVSYARARAESLGFDCKVGLLSRFERLFLIAVGLIFGFIYQVMVFLAVFTHVTAIHRIIHVYSQHRRQEAREAGSARDA